MTAFAIYWIGKSYAQGEIARDFILKSLALIVLPVFDVWLFFE